MNTALWGHIDSWTLGRPRRRAMSPRPAAVRGSLLWTVSQALALLAAAYAVVAGIGLPVPRLTLSQHASSLAWSAALDVVLLAGFAAHFHFVQRGTVRRWLPVRMPRLVDRALDGSLAAVLLAGFFFLWQPLPLAVWQSRAPLPVAALYCGLALGWLLLLGAGLRAQQLLAAQRPVPSDLRTRLALALLLVEWCTPRMSVGQLLLATCLSIYVLLVFGAEFFRVRSHVKERVRCKPRS